MPVSMLEILMVLESMIVSTMICILLRDAEAIIASTTGTIRESKLPMSIAVEREMRRVPGVVLRRMSMLATM